MSKIKVFLSLHCNWSFWGLCIRTDNEHECICAYVYFFAKCKMQNAQLTSFANENVQFGQHFRITIGFIMWS